MGIKGLLSWFSAAAKTQTDRNYDVVYLDFMAICHLVLDPTFMSFVQQELHKTEKAKARSQSAKGRGGKGGRRSEARPPLTKIEVAEQASHKDLCIGLYIKRLEALLDQIVGSIQPTKMIFIAMDGASVAKVPEKQRRRQKYSGLERVFRAALTPGTITLREIAGAAWDWATKYAKSVNIECILSDAAVEQEGEVKIFNHLIRCARAAPDATFAIVSNDSDVLLAGVASLARNVFLTTLEVRQQAVAVNCFSVWNVVLMLSYSLHSAFAGYRSQCKGSRLIYAPWLRDLEGNEPATPRPPGRKPKPKPKQGQSMLTLPQLLRSLQGRLQDRIDRCTESSAVYAIFNGPWLTALNREIVQYCKHFESRVTEDLSALRECSKRVQAAQQMATSAANTAQQLDQRCGMNIKADSVVHQRLVKRRQQLKTWEAELLRSARHLVNLLHSNATEVEARRDAAEGGDALPDAAGGGTARAAGAQGVNGNGQADGVAAPSAGADVGAGVDAEAEATAHATARADAAAESDIGGAADLEVDAAVAADTGADTNARAHVRDAGDGGASVGPPAAPPAEAAADRGPGRSAPAGAPAKSTQAPEPVGVTLCESALNALRYDAVFAVCLCGSDFTPLVHGTSLADLWRGLARYYRDAARRGARDASIVRPRDGVLLPHWPNFRAFLRVVIEGADDATRQQSRAALERQAVAVAPPDGAPAGAGETGPEPAGAQPVCKQFLSGHCQFGRECKYRHSKPSDVPRPEAKADNPCGPSPSGGGESGEKCKPSHAQAAAADGGDAGAGAGGARDPPAGLALASAAQHLQLTYALVRQLNVYACGGVRDLDWTFDVPKSVFFTVARLHEAIGDVAAAPAAVEAEWGARLVGGETRLAGIRTATCLAASLPLDMAHMLPPPLRPIVQGLHEAHPALRDATWDAVFGFLQQRIRALPAAALKGVRDGEAVRYYAHPSAAQGLPYARGLERPDPDARAADPWWTMARDPVPVDGGWLDPATEGLLPSVWARRWHPPPPCGP